MATTDDEGAIRCDKHHTHMVKVRVRYLDSELEGPAFQCTKPDCTRYFTERGYFDVIDNQVLAEKFQQRCPRCNIPMYLREAEKGIEIWHCQAPECGHEQRIAA